MVLLSLGVFVRQDLLLLEQGSASSALLTLKVREFSAVGGLFCAF